jgi:hypothetical protein
MRSPPTIVERALEPIVGAWRHFEHKVIIPIFEGLVRLWLHLNPRVYSSGLRVRSVSKGRGPDKGKKFIIFVIYSRLGLSPFVKNFIGAVGNSPFNLVVVSNAPLDAGSKSYLLDNACLVIERVNLGRDFGAYKDGLAILQQQFPEIERLLLINDSLFFFERGLDGMLAALDGPQQFIGLTEVFEYHYHVQSFMLSFGSQVIRHPRFTRFWKRYRPISTRRWSIHKGEVGLTRTLAKAGFTPHVLFHGAQLLEHLRGRPLGELLEAVALLPTFFRERLLERVRDLYEANADKPDSFASLSAGMRYVRFAPADDEALRNIRAASIRQLKALAEQSSTLTNWASEELLREIVSTITTRNQVHVGGFLFMKYLGLPVIKRDILYRTVYTIEEIYDALTELKVTARDEAIDDLRRTGTVAHFGLFRRLLFRHGSI